MRKYSSIIYINFSQYDNTGRILDYLLETFEIVLHFSFDHLRLKHGRKTNILTIYKQGIKSKTINMYSLRVPPSLQFPSLPLVALLMIFQTIWHTLKHVSALGIRPIFFTVNAYPALIGILMKKLCIVTKVYFWVWDYYPPGYPDWHMRIIRSVYIWFDTLALYFADKLIFPNRRQFKLRNTIKKIRNHLSIIPLGASKPATYKNTTSNIIGFMGMLKESQGIELALSTFDLIHSHCPTVTIEIVGSGPMEDILRARAKSYGKHIRFYGFIEDQNTLNAIIKRWFAGLAVYKPTLSNESCWGDPSKIKTYLSQGVPIITTNVTEYGAKARKYGFGLTIPYDGKHLAQAVKTLHINQRVFRKKALSYAFSFYYRNVYTPMFQDS